MKKSFYEILEVSTTASQETIDAVYRVLHEKYSSRDSAQYPDAAEQLKFLRIAHGVISDPAKRAVYDKRLATAKAEAAQPAPTPIAEQPIAAPPQPPVVTAAAPATDNSLLVTPVDLIAQLKEANRNTGPREDIAERLTAIATKPLVAAIVGLVFVGSVTYKSMQPAKPPSAAAAQARQGPFVPDPLAAAALDAAQKLGARVEADISYKEYAAAVADLAAQTKTYLASAGAGKNPKLGAALEKLLDAHVRARDIWAIKMDHPEVFSGVDPDNSHYRKVVSIYPPAAQIAKPQDERGQNVKLDIDAVLNALWQEGRRAFSDARRFNSGTT